MSELEYRILANLIFQQTNQLFTKLVALIQILQRETLHTRIRVSLKKEKRGIKRVYSTYPLSPADIRWQLITYGYTATVSFIITSLSQIAKPIDRSRVIAIIQQSDSLRASIPIFSNSSFSPNDILKSLRQIKKAIRIALMLDYTDIKSTNILFMYLAQEATKALTYLNQEA